MTLFSCHVVFKPLYTFGNIALPMRNVLCLTHAPGIQFTQIIPMLQHWVFIFSFLFLPLWVTTFEFWRMPLLEAVNTWTWFISAGMSSQVRIDCVLLGGDAITKSYTDPVFSLKMSWTKFWFSWSNSVVRAPKAGLHIFSTMCCLLPPRPTAWVGLQILSWPMQLSFWPKQLIRSCSKWLACKGQPCRCRTLRPTQTFSKQTTSDTKVPNILVFRKPRFLWILARNFKKFGT